MNTKNSYKKILAGMLVVALVLLLFKSGYIAGKFLYKTTHQAENKKP